MDLTMISHLMSKTTATCIVILQLSACATGDPSTVDKLSMEGIKFAQLVDPAARAAIAPKVSREAALLEEARSLTDDADEETRRKIRKAALARSEKGIGERQAILSDLTRSSEALERYFKALAALATTTAPATAGAAAEKSANGFIAIATSLAGKSIGGEDIARTSNPATSFIISSAQSAALQKEFRERGKAVHESLGVYVDVFAKMEEQAAGDAEVLRLLDHRDQVEIPYLAKTKLPATWAKDFAKLNGPPAPAVAAIRDARKSATQLRDAYGALIEGRLVATELDAVTGSLKRLEAVLKAIRDAETAPAIAAAPATQTAL